MLDMPSWLLVWVLFALLLILAPFIRQVILAIYYYQRDLIAQRDAARAELQALINLKESYKADVEASNRRLEVLETLSELPFSYADRRESDDYVTIRQRAREDVRVCSLMYGRLDRRLSAGRLQSKLRKAEFMARWRWVPLVHIPWTATNEALIDFVRWQAGVEERW